MNFIELLKSTLSNAKDRKIDNKQKLANESLLQRDALLDAIAQSALKLLETPDWHKEIHDLLRLLGQATNASHAYLFENRMDENLELVTSQKYEWVGPGQSAEIDNPDFQNVPIMEKGMSDWVSMVSNGKPFYNSTKIFKPEWADMLSRHEIKTLLDVPIFVDGNWWGVIGFDDCVREMAWSQAEVSAMQAAAGLLGAAIKRQLADEALRASEDKFQTIFHQTFVPMVIGRMSDRIILDANEAFCNLTDYSLEEVIDQSARQFSLWGNYEEYEQHKELLTQQGYIREFKAKYRKKSGQIGVALLSAANIKIKSESCLLYTLYDITKSEDLLNELQDKNSELERFTYTVSHDLKAPLITLGGFAGLLERDILSGNADKAKQDMKRIKEAIQKMEQLLNELLELSRIGRMVNDPENVPFNEIAEEAVRSVEGQLNKNQTKVQIEADLPVVCVDRIRIVEAVQNMVDNASKFMGGQTNPEIKIGATHQNGEQVFFVKDNGVGIEPIYHERIFGLFNKLDAKTEGTGIGLALVKRIIEFHGGRIWVESELGNGAAFYFTLGTAQTKMRVI
ncbi:MAG: PAS domain S-box protein [Anaerolineales bacterium]|nr:PAS domain S-box protein [Anaerolineales bacterium]